MQGVGIANESLTAILTTTDDVFVLIDEIAVAAGQQGIAAAEISTHSEKLQAWRIKIVSAPGKWRKLPGTCTD